MAELDPQDARLRIAIIGGGLAGTTVANALFRIPNLDVHVFESAPKFSERGAAVGLSSNAQDALKHIIPESASLLEKAGAVPMNCTRLVLVSFGTPSPFPSICTLYLY